MTSTETAALLHLLGFVTGIALYGLLAVMVVRGGAAGRTAAGESAAAGRVMPASRIALATGLLGLLWNAGALLIHGARDFRVPVQPSPWLAAAAFAALGFLPAVVVHAALQGRRTPSSRVLVALAYALSTAAALMQAAAAARAELLPFRPALLTLTVGYVVLTAAIALQRHRFGGGRALSAVALAVFAVSSLHLGQHAESGESWLLALLGHHASIPLAIVVLYQDYRFALLDVFLKRALSFMALVAFAAALYGLAAGPVLDVLPVAADDVRRTAVLLAFAVITALAYPPLHQAIAFFVDQVVLRRADYGRARAAVAAELERADDEPAALEAATAALSAALGAEVRWHTRQDAPSAAEALLEAAPGAARDRGVVVVPTTDPPAFVLEVGALAGGRRLLSDDLALLESVALLTGRRIDALRVSRERYERDLREAEMRRLASEAELGALRAQLNPHFLFNALNTLGYLMQAAPARAQQTLLNLTGLLRAVLYRSQRERCTLGEEVELVETYLAIESARFEERLRVVIDLPAELRALPVPPLLLQPLVENAVKHGIAPLREGGTVTVRAELCAGAPVTAGPAGTLRLTVHDSGTGAAPRRLRSRDEHGVGLANLERRLARYYGASAALEVRSTPGQGTTAVVHLPAEQPPAADAAGGEAAGASPAASRRRSARATSEVSS